MLDVSTVAEHGAALATPFFVNYWKSLVIWKLISFTQCIKFEVLTRFARDSLTLFSMPVSAILDFPPKVDNTVEVMLHSLGSINSHHSHPVN